MARLRRVAALCLLLLGLAAVPALAEVSAPLDRIPETQLIYQDFTRDGVVDGHYSVDAMRAALRAASPTDPSFARFEDALNRAMDRDGLGISNGGGSTGSEGSLLPSPPGIDGAGDGPPWPFIALSVLGGLLIVSGVGSSIYRHTRR
jgi:hypothetical protein